MKKALIFFFGGMAASLIGFLIGLPFHDRLLRWSIVGVCIAIFCHGYYNKQNRRLLLTPFIGGSAVILGWFLGKYITYTMVVWPLFGAIIGLTDPSRLKTSERIKKTLFGFLGGFVGVHFFPILFFGVFPWLGVPFIAWDIEKMGLIFSGGAIAVGIGFGRKIRQ
jgi:hypothetical protein